MGYYVYKERFVNGEPLLDSLRKAIAIADESVSDAACEVT